MGFPLLDIVGIGAKLIDKLIPDPKAKAEAMEKLKELDQAGELAKMNADLAVMSQQVEIDKIEAASTNMFIAGWRPAVGWVCVLGLAITVFSPLLGWGAALFGHAILVPAIPMDALMTLLIGMLGLGGMRTVEKLNNAEKNR